MMTNITKKEKSESVEWIKALVIAVILATIIRYFLFAPIVVDGESMMPTLQDEDRMIVNKIEIGEYERFEVVVFHASEEKDYIKRIIGLPGDEVEYKNDQLFINGIFYDEPYLEQQKERSMNGLLTESFRLEDTPGGHLKVPEGHVFVLGDNRKFSKDSRHIGVVSLDKIIGTSQIVYWPLNRIQVLKDKQ